MKNSFLFIFLTLFLTSNICAGKLSDIKIFNSNDDYVTYKVEIVTSPEEQEKGLMFRDKLKIKEGMLFIFDSPKKASFWMKNTLISLDLIYIKNNGLIIFEIGFDQAKIAKKALEEKNFNVHKIVKDLSGIERILIAKPN